MGGVRTPGRRERRVSGRLAALAVVLAVALPAAVPAPATGAATGAVIEADLSARLRSVPDGEPVPVLVEVDAPTPDPAARYAAVGPLPVSHVFDLGPPGFAVSLTRSQAEALAREPGVRRLSLDVEVHAFMSTAVRTSGVPEARADFGVTGDGDGDPATYSPDDAVICVLDTGIDANHADLDEGKVIGWKDFIHGRPNPYDDNGHGTHVAGIAAGSGDGNAALRGVAPGAALVGVKVLDAGGSGSTSTVRAGVEWCVENRDALGIEILSLSLGTSGGSDGKDSLSQAVNAAGRAGLLVVVAAGNNGPARKTVGSPGAAAEALTVGAMADPGESGYFLASFSSRGPALDDRIKPDVVAPGVSITAPRAGTASGYTTLSGTSMATPFVSGVAALLAARGIPASGIKGSLILTAQDWGPPGMDVDYGWGRVLAYDAVREALGGGGASPPSPGHGAFAGTLGQFGRNAMIPLYVTDASAPLALTMIIPDWLSFQPDFNLYLYAPGADTSKRSNAFLKSETSSRQEGVRIAVPAVGLYTAEVLANNGQGKWYLDASGHLDLRAPVTAATTTGPEGRDGWYLGPVEVALAATDDASGVNTTSHRKEPPLGSPEALYAGPFEVSGDGVFTLEYWSVDFARNEEAKRKLDLRIDSAPPSTTHALGGPVGDDGWFLGDVKVNLEAEDATSGVASTLVSLDDAAFAQGTTATVTGDGTHDLRYFSEDVAGNAEPEREVRVPIDATPPTVRLDVGAPRHEGARVFVTNRTPFAVVADDATSGVRESRYRVDAGDWIAYGSPFTLDGPDGARAIAVDARDVAGNAALPADSAFFLDDTAPRADLLSPKSGQVFAPGASPVGPFLLAPRNSPLDRVYAVRGAVLEVRVNATDPIVGGDASGTDRVVLHLDGAALATLAGAPWTHALDTSGLPAGDHVLRVTSYDRVGNSAFSEARIFILGADAPAAPPLPAPPQVPPGP